MAKNKTHIYPRKPMNETAFWKGRPSGGTWEYMPTEQFSLDAQLDTTVTQKHFD